MNDDIRNQSFFNTFCEVSDWVFEEFHKFDGIRSSLADQITRSVDSVGANLVEGYGRGSEESIRAVLQFYRYSLGSAFESLYWLERAISRGMINRTKGAAMHKSLDTACKELQSFMNKMIASEPKKGKK